MPDLDRACAVVESKAPATANSGPLAIFPRITGEDCYVRLDADSLHELMSPVNQISTLLELLARKYGGTLDREGDTLFGFVQGSANRLQNLVAGLRTYMRVAGSSRLPRLCDANKLLAGAKVSVQPDIDRSGAIVTQDPLPEIYCDPSQIGFAFASLMENSIKFRRECRPEIHISASTQDNAWVFAVRDNGIGIDPTGGERIFGLFRRVQNDTRPGAGLGLAITRQIVEQHGGRIWLESQPDVGSTFYFSLPLFKRAESANCAAQVLRPSTCSA